MKILFPCFLFIVFLKKNYAMLTSNKYHLSSKFSIAVTKHISDLLAGADKTGHNVLHSNSQLIHKILESNLSFELKKDLSLMCIKLAQFGDHTGSNILEFYHHFVQNFL